MVLRHATDIFILPEPMREMWLVELLYADISIRKYPSQRNTYPRIITSIQPSVVVKWVYMIVASIKSEKVRVDLWIFPLLGNKSELPVKIFSCPAGLAMFS